MEMIIEYMNSIKWKLSPFWMSELEEADPQDPTSTCPSVPGSRDAFSSSTSRYPLTERDHCFQSQMLSKALY